MYILDYFKSFFDFDRLDQYNFLVRYLTLTALSAVLFSIDEKLFQEVNSGMTIVPEGQWTENGYFFKKVITFFSLVIFWIGFRRYKDILNVKKLNILPFSLFAFIGVALTYYGYEIILFAILLFIPTKKMKNE